MGPFEVEAALIKHEAVLEAAVVGNYDQDGLVKPKGFIVLNKNFAGSDELASELINFVKINDWYFPSGYIILLGACFFLDIILFRFLCPVF